MPRSTCAPASTQRSSASALVTPPSRSRWTSTSTPCRRCSARPRPRLPHSYTAGCRERPRLGRLVYLGGNRGGCRLRGLCLRQGAEQTRAARIERCIDFEVDVLLRLLAALPKGSNVTWRDAQMSDLARTLPVGLIPL